MIVFNSLIIADPRNCTGCKACEVACAIAHMEKPVLTAGMVTEPLYSRVFVVKSGSASLSVRCRHCEDAPCARACPVGAVTQKNNVVLINSDKCIGCKTCAIVCPFGSIELVYREKEHKVVAHKCDLCEGRPGGPACVEACSSKALSLLDGNSLRSLIQNHRLASVQDLMNWVHIHQSA